MTREEAFAMAKDVTALFLQIAAKVPVEGITEIHYEDIKKIYDQYEVEPKDALGETMLFLETLSEHGFHDCAAFKIAHDLFVLYDKEGDGKTKH